MNAAIFHSIIYLQIIILIFIGLAVIYILVFSIAGLFYKDKPVINTHTFRKMAVLIPGYKEDDVIVEVALEALKQNYPVLKFDVIIIADSFLEETIHKLNKLPVKVIKVSFEKSTKSKALNKAMELLPDIYDIAVVLDADNVMESDFLNKINSAFEKNIIAVQGHRAAKNLNNGLAVLDAVSEEINNHIFRKGHRVLGLSSAIIGSGMAFQYAYFKAMMKNVTAVGGFDKEIELKMLSEGLTIEYLNNAWIFDEKIQKSDAFTNQRRRWLSAQFHYFKQDIGKAILSFFTRGNIDYLDKAIQFIQPPRILLLGATLILTIICIISNSIIGLPLMLSVLWFIVLSMCALAMLLSVPKNYYNKKTLHALTNLPKGMLLMLGSLLKIKNANKQFLHTKHGNIEHN